MEKLEVFIEKARKVHGDRYDYSKVEYVDSVTKVCIICPKHGEFWQTPQGHIRGNICPICSKECRGVERRSNSEDFIQKAHETHGDMYDYSKTEYVNARTKVCIICPEHGEFWQLPIPHLKGQGCPKCAGKEMDKDLFIEKARKTHGNLYDYSKVEYKCSSEKVCIICPKHGEFWQTPAKHIYGRGCPKCGKVSMADKLRLGVDEFIKRANETHGNKYDYSKVEEFKTLHEKVTVICPKHGEFQQLAYDHMNGHGCPKCGQNETKTEDEIYEYICSLVGEENVVRKDRTILKRREIDILIPEKKTGFEYNGLRWHSEKFGKDCRYHVDKIIDCLSAGIDLIQIYEDEYLYHKEAVKSRIKNLLLDINEKTETDVGEIDKETAKDFLDTNSLWGYRKSTLFVGLKQNGVLEFVVGFKKISGFSEWEITVFGHTGNFQSSYMTNVFSFFVKTFNPQVVRVFVDRGWDKWIGSIYEANGFYSDMKISPKYMYANLNTTSKRISRDRYNMLSLEEQKNYSKIWDCGVSRYIWKSNR